MEEKRIKMDEPIMEPTISTREWLANLSETKLYKLACKQLTREGKCVILHRNAGVVYYEVDPCEVILKGLEILNIAHKKGFTL